MAAPVAVVQIDDDPVPRVEVTVVAEATAATVTVFRWANGVRTVVRGAYLQPVAGSTLVVDYEAPLGVPVYYTAITYAADGTPSTESEPSNTVVLEIADRAYLQDPLAPEGSVAVNMTDQPADRGRPHLIDPSLTQFTYGIDTTELSIAASAIPIGIGGVRRVASGMPLVIAAWTEQQASAIRDLMNRAWPLCLRIPTSIRQLQGLAYLAVGDLTETATDRYGGTVTFTMTATRVRPPGSNVVISPRTWDDLVAEASTWNDVVAIYATWVDAQRG